MYWFLSTACLISTLVSATLIDQMNRALVSDFDQLFKIMLEPGEEFTLPDPPKTEEKATIAEILAQSSFSVKDLKSIEAHEHLHLYEDNVKSRNIRDLMLKYLLDPHYKNSMTDQNRQELLAHFEEHYGSIHGYKDIFKDANEEVQVPTATTLAQVRNDTLRYSTPVMMNHVMDYIFDSKYNVERASDGPFYDVSVVKRFYDDFVDATMPVDKMVLWFHYRPLKASHDLLPIMDKIYDRFDTLRNLYPTSSLWTTANPP
jgi:hypothetical protein